MKLIILSCFTLLLFNVVAFAQNPSPVFPTENWEYDKCNAIAGIRPFIIDSMNTTGLMIVYQGKVIFSYGDVKEQSYIASCRKSILAMLYGIYVDKGLIDLQKTMEELGIDDVQGLLPLEKTATIDHLLSARSGVYHPSSYPGDDLAFAPKRGIQKPGSYFLYNNWDFNAAGAIFEQLTDMNIYDALEKDLAGPLQMQDFDRSLQKKTGNMTASKYPAYPMNLSVRDLSRIGYLMLQKGHWAGKSLISEQWIDQITKVLTPNEEMNPARLKNSSFGYARYWWVFDKENQKEELDGAYTAQGIYGQYLTVIPKLDMVIAHKTNALFQRHTTNFEVLLNLIIENSQHLKTKKKSVGEEDFAKYIGKYSNEKLTMEIFVENAKLYMTSPLGKLTLIPCDANSFSFEEEDRFSLKFSFENGVIKNFILTPDTINLGVFAKVK